MNRIAIATFGIAIAGAVGALARFGIWYAANTYITTRFPFGTLLINVSGAFCLGMLSTALPNTPAAETWRLILGIGFLGAFTTFSSMMLETDTMASNGNYLFAAAYIALSLFLGLIAVRAGILFGRI